MRVEEVLRRYLHEAPLRAAFDAGLRQRLREGRFARYPRCCAGGCGRSSETCERCASCGRSTARPSCLTDVAARERVERNAELLARVCIDVALHVVAASESGRSLEIAQCYISRGSREADVETAYERGWSTLENGELLRLAEAEGFDVLVTTDRNLRHQQNLSKRTIAIVVSTTPSWPRVEKAKQLVVDAIAGATRGSFSELDVP